LIKHQNLDQFFLNGNFNIIDLVHSSIIVFIYHNDFLDTNIDDENLSKDFLEKINLILKKLMSLKKNNEGRNQK
jgi:hypothetical protein